MPYLKSNQIFFCPSATGLNPSAAIDPANIAYGYDYAVLSPGNVVGTSLAAIQRPTQTVLIADSSKNNNHYVVTSNPDVTSDGISVVHLEGANVAFCDGHVKWVKTPGPLQDPAQ